MTSLPEQLSAASTRQISAQLDAQFRFFNTLATQALDNASRLVSLNLSTSRDSVERSSHTIRQLVQATQARDLLVLRSHAEEQVRSLFNYGRELFNITANAQPYGLRTIAAPVQPVTLAAPLVKQAVEATEDVVQQAASTVARSYDVVTEVVTEAATEASTASTTESVTEAAGPVAQVDAPEPVALEEAPGAAVEAQARVGQQPEPVARQKQIAKAASGKGASKAAVPAQPLAAPVEEQESASVTRIETPSKRRK